MTAAIDMGAALQEPTENWTIEQLMEWCLQRSQQETDEKVHEIISLEKNQLEQGKQELWECFNKLHASTKEQNNTDKEMKTISTSFCVRFKVVSGPYMDQEFVVKPQLDRPCWVGRSTSKRFRDHGISLRKDTEVSTTHGKFELIQGGIYFTDVGSTNGSHIGDTLLMPNVPHQLEEGMSLLLGSSALLVHFE